MQDCFYEIVKSVVKAFEEGNDIVTFSEDSTYVITQKTFIIINSNATLFYKRVAEKQVKKLNC